MGTIVVIVIIVIIVVLVLVVFIVLTLWLTARQSGLKTGSLLFGDAFLRLLQGSLTMVL